MSQYGVGDKKSNSAGGGTYVDGSMKITVNESGGQSERYNYVGGGGLSNFGWNVAGTGYNQGDQYSKLSYNGSGSYAHEFHGGVMSGTQKTNGHNNSSSDFRLDYTLNNDGWAVTSGRNGASGNSLSRFEYAGSGTYLFTVSEDGYSRTLSGSMSEDGHNTGRSSFNTSGVLNVAHMEWDTAGSGLASSDNHEHLFYEGSGSYVHQIHGGTVRGSASEKYDNFTSGAGQAKSVLVDSEWIVSASGGASGLSYSQTKYDGKGNYSRTVGQGADAVVYTGEQKQSGHTTVWQQWQTKSSSTPTIQSSELQGYALTDARKYSYFSGSANYSRATPDGLGTVRGKRNEEREDLELNNSDVHTYAYEIDSPTGHDEGLTQWGSASAKGSGFANTNWDGKADYDKSWTVQQGEATTKYTGTSHLEEKGHIKSRYSASSLSYLSSQGTWVLTSGQGSSSGDNYDYSFGKVTGKYTTTTTGENDYASESKGGFTNTNKAENFTNWSEASSVAANEFRQVAGTASGSGNSETVTSSAGTGNYSHNRGGYNSRITGTVNEDNFSKDETKYTTSSKWNAIDGWATTGSLTGDGNSRYHYDFNGTGRMNTINPLSNAYDSSPAVTGLMGNVNENGETNKNTKYSSVSKWDDGNENPTNGQAPTSASWKLESGAGSSWGNGRTHIDWDGTGSYASGGFDNRWGNWSVRGETTTKGHNNTNNKWETNSAVRLNASGTAKEWTTLGGAASDWGDSFNEIKASGSGSWTATVAGLTVAKGTVEQKSTERDTDQWNTGSELELPDPGEDHQEALVWRVLSGDASASSYAYTYERFDYANSTYANSGASWMTGTMKAYGFEETTDNADWKSVWGNVQVTKSNPDGSVTISLEPGWKLVSGSGRIDVSAGDGKEYSGSGSFATSGVTISYGNGASWTDGKWSYSGKATQSGKYENSVGAFVAVSVQNGEWAETDSGGTASGLVEERWKYDGSGTYTRGAMSGSFGDGSESFFDDRYKFTDLSDATKNSDRDSNWNQNGYSYYSASGNASLLGVDGTYKEGGSGKWSSSGTVDYDWDESIAPTLLEKIAGISHAQWIAKSGTAKDQSSAAGSNSFDGNVTFDDTYSERSFENSFKEETTEYYSAVPQLATRENFPDGRPVSWTMSSGSHISGASGKEDSYDETFSVGLTPIYKIVAVGWDIQTDHSEYNWDRTSTHNGSTWNTKGKGLDTGFSRTESGYDGLEIFGTNGGSGAIYERETNNSYFTYSINKRWEDTAGGSRPGTDGTVGPGGQRNEVSDEGNNSAGGRWDLTGSASGFGDGTWKIGKDLTQDWTAVVHGHAFTGKETIHYKKQYAYSSHDDYVLDDRNNTDAKDDIFKLTALGGSGDGSGEYTRSASAGGSYTDQFDYGYGTIKGTAQASVRDHWDYKLHEDFGMETKDSKKSWVVSSSGTANFDGFSKWEYAGGGNYAVSYNHADAVGHYNWQSSASVHESAHDNSYYSGKETWQDNVYDYREDSWGDSLSDYKYSSHSEHDSSYSYNYNGWNNYGNSNSESDYLETKHSESKFRNTVRESMTAAGFSQITTASGSSSSERNVASSGISHSEGTSTFSSPTYYYWGHYVYDTSNSGNEKWTNSSSWNSVTYENGSGFSQTNDAGNYIWNFQNRGDYSYQWYETRYHADGTSESSGGSGSYPWDSPSVGSSPYSYPETLLTPPDPNYVPPVLEGDGKTRYPAGDIPLAGAPTTLQLPDTSLPNNLPVMPELGMDSVPGLDTLGLATWLKLSAVEWTLDFGDSIIDAMLNPGDTFRWLADGVAGRIEEFGSWLTDVTGIDGFEIGGSWIASGVRDIGEIAGTALDAFRDALIDVGNFISNLSFADVLDGLQVALDVAGLIPAVGEIADLGNAAISAARGDYAGAALSVAAAIPIAGWAAAPAKVARFAANRADDALAAGRLVKCKVTGTGCFVAGTQVWLSATVQDDPAPLQQQAAGVPDTSNNHDGSTLAATMLAERTLTKQPIESVVIGSRVSGDNPRPWEFDDELPEPDQATWMLAHFALQKEDGSWIDVDMIRPAQYWQSQSAIPGNYVLMQFPELEASGLALVKSLDPCPPIAAGSGNVVTARIVTRQTSSLIEIQFGDGNSLTGTPQHPIWSIERQDWVQLSDLQSGEHLLSEAAPVEITSTRHLTTAESVYNLEIHGHHIYQVTELGVLVHNAGLAKYRRRKNGQFAAKPGPKTEDLSSVRQSAVRKAWKEEQRRAKDGLKTSRRWELKQLKELKKTGKVKGFVGHHMKSVAKYRKLAGDPKNIQFLTQAQHLKAHRGNFRNPTHGRFRE